MYDMSMKERKLAYGLRELSDQSGSHSPSIHTIAEKLPELEIKIDACFLSNPYATDLFTQEMKNDLIKTGDLRKVLEFYPSQNQVIGELLSGCLNVPTEKIFVGNGATEIIQAVIHNFTYRKIIINIPTFSPYYEFVSDDVQVVYNQLTRDNDFHFDLEEYIRLVEKERPDTIILINPNNPTGGYIDQEDIEYLVDRLSFVDTIVLDESFIHFAFEDDSMELKTAIPLTQKYKNLIIMKSMSKDFGIAGIRAGYAVMDEEKVADLLENGYLWNLSGLAEYFFRLYADEDFLERYEKVRIRYLMDTQAFFAQLSEVPGLKVYPSKANFVLAEITNGMSAFEFMSRMLIKHGVYVRDCNDKVGLDGEFVRIASRTKDENAAILQAAQEVLQGQEETV
ncbi:pyridoxal phosphate-dependent aminotransferase [Desulfovermiculus halophilus]|uniref:pyridoxal phosphate-dependent aminotransferase n=1 Tax=Desulfovermiculus halophilus TaxID=339722 RepID=UPI0005593AE8|nr:histidinol-phosphate transaminase [Desulfovermiculus halophilus]